MEDCRGFTTCIKGKPSPSNFQHLLIMIIQIYKQATIFFLQDRVPTIANVIPTMDRIDDLLSEAAKRPLVPAVKHALKFARASINKYYSKTDASDIYRIAMGETNYYYICQNQTN